MLKKKSKIQLSKNQKVFRTRPDTRQDSRGQLGRGRNAIITWNSKKFVTNVPTNQHSKV